MDKLPADFEARFEKDGYFIVKDFLSPDVVEAVKTGAGKSFHFLRKITSPCGRGEVLYCSGRREVRK